MSKKRTFAELNNDDQTNEGSEYDAKRAKLDSLSDTTLQDLPMELFEDILIKAIVLEVKGMKLAKCAWNEKADLVMNRLRNVSAHWNNILTTNYFRIVLARTLEGTGQASIRLEILYEHPFSTSNIRAITSLNDEIWLLQEKSDGRDGTYRIAIYNRNDMDEVKDVIPVTDHPYPGLMDACNVSNCVYLCMTTEVFAHRSVARISKAATEHQFDVTPWIENQNMDWNIRGMSVSKGSLAVLSKQWGVGSCVIDVYDTNGALQRVITFPIDSRVYDFCNLFQKSNGNFVVPYDNMENDQINLLEIDTAGMIVRQHGSSHDKDFSCVDCADGCGRILIAELHRGIELLDSQFNFLRAYNLPQEDETMTLYYEKVQYDSQRGEVICFTCDMNDWTNKDLTILRFVEE